MSVLRCVVAQIPKKTKLYVEQTKREKLQAGEIHRAFQKDLCRLRLHAARTYVATLTDNRQGVSAVGGAASLRLHARCQGLVSDEVTGTYMRIKVSPVHGSGE